MGMRAQVYKWDAYDANTTPLRTYPIGIPFSIFVGKVGNQLATLPKTTATQFYCD